MAQPGTTLERHLTVEELDETWLVSKNFVRRLFQNEPGLWYLIRPDPAEGCIGPSEYPSLWPSGFMGD